MTDEQGPTLRIFVARGSTEGYELREFLQRHHISAEWVELASDEECLRHLGYSRLKNVRLPVVEFPDGTQAFCPEVRDVADRLGLVARPRLREYDVSIYGAGPAGLSAAVYAASEGLSTIVIEKRAIGGQAGSSSLIENYMGFPQGISGFELAERAREQAVKFGAEIVLMSEGIRGEFRAGRIHAELASGITVTARANICATGVEYRRLGLEREGEFLGKGLYYGAGAAEAPWCKDQVVVVVGGANSAGQAVMHLADYAKQVLMVVRRSALKDTMSSYLRERIESHARVEVLYNAHLGAVDGNGQVEHATVVDKNGDVLQRIDTGRVFVAIGGSPNTEWAQDTLITRNEAGYLVTGPDLTDGRQLPDGWPLERAPYFLETSVPGSFAAGDVRHGAVKRVVTAAGEGAMAVTFVHRYLEEDFPRLAT